MKNDFFPKELQLRTGDNFTAFDVESNAIRYGDLQSLLRKEKRALTLMEIAGKTGATTASVKRILSQGITRDAVDYKFRSNGEIEYFLWDVD